MRARLGLFGCAAALALLVAPAEAKWLPAKDLSEPGSHIGSPSIVLAAEGSAIAIWDRWNGTDTVVEAAYRPAGKHWLKPVDLSSPPAEDGEGEEIPGVHSASGARIAVDGDGDATATWEEYAGTNRLLIRSARKPADGDWQEPVTVGEVNTMAAPEPWIAVDADGNATVVWKDEVAGVIVSAYRPVGEPWEAPVEVSGAGAYVPQAAVGAEGDATVIWMRFDGAMYVVESAFRPADGEWEGPTVVSEPGEEGGNPQIALGAQGDVMAIWRGEGGGYDAVRASYRPPGGDWQPVVNVSGEGEEVHSPQIALDPSGNALAAWGASDGELGSHAIAKAAFRPAGADWEAPVVLSEDGQNAHPSEIAFDKLGNGTIVWLRFDGDHYVVQAAYRPVGGDWEQARDLSDDSRSAMDPSIVLAAPGNAVAANGAATAVWSIDEGKDCKPESAGCVNDRVVQAAGYNVHAPAAEKLEVPEEGEVGVPVEVAVPPVDVWYPLVDFGDGTIAAGAAATHTYSEPGEYTVRFSSADVLGYEASAQRTISIAPGEGSPEPEPDPDVEQGQASPPGPPPSPPPSPECTSARIARSLALRRLRATSGRLRLAPTPAEARALRLKKRHLAAALRRAGRQVGEAC
jgi:PKD domain-containing protein